MRRRCRITTKPFKGHKGQYNHMHSHHTNRPFRVTVLTSYKQTKHYQKTCSSSIWRKMCCKFWQCTWIEKHSKSQRWWTLMFTVGMIMSYADFWPFGCSQSFLPEKSRLDYGTAYLQVWTRWILNRAKGFWREWKSAYDLPCVSPYH